MRFARAIAVIGGYTMLSRILGYVRDAAIAAVLGAGPVADAFFVAFKLPNLFRRLFAEGAFNAAFVPLFAGTLAAEGREAARAVAEEALAVMVAALLLVTAVAQAAMPWLMLVFAPGFADDPERFGLAVLFTRVTFPYLLFVSLVALLGGVLNAMGRFAAAAAAPILLNLCLIGALLALTPRLATPGHALAWGVSAAGVLQFVWLLVACARAGMVLRLRRPRLTPNLRRLLKRIAPGAIGAGAVQINLMIGVVLASLLPTGAVSMLYYADRIVQLPLGVIGVAVGTALLPLLAGHIRAGAEEEARRSLNRALEAGLLLGLPAAVALFVLAGPVVSALFGRGAFNEADVAATALALMAFSAGLPAYILIKVLGPAFYAAEDTATPMRVALVAVAANLGLNLALMGPLAHVGLALGATISAWLNAGLLALTLGRRGLLVPDERFRHRTPRIAAASLVMGLGLVVAGSAAADLLASPAFRIPVFAALVAGGAAVFFAAAHGLGAANLAEIRALFGSRKPA